MILDSARKTQIRTEVASLLKTSGYGEDLPIYTEKIAETIDYTASGFFPDDTVLKDVWGMVDHARQTISINKTLAPRGQHFTLAHEIGHAVLHQNESFVDYRKNITDPSSQKEKEANYFASELLMPFELFCSHWIHFKGDLQKMATKFGVNTEAIRIRALELRLS